MQRHWRTVWISDTHLGTKGCRAAELSLLLKHIRCERLYLVGDIIDMDRLRQRWYWPAKHNDVVRRILTHARHGTEVVFVPGNHDDGARQYLHLQFGGVQVRPHAEHRTADGRRLFICHGDQYDLIVTHSPALAAFGGMAYEWLLKLNRLYNWTRHKCGRPYMSLSQAIKLRVKKACTVVSRFEESLTREARRRGVDGVVCGHIHKPEVRHEPNHVTYYNCGDWVESCTALVEDHDGRVQLLDGLAFADAMRDAHAPSEKDADPDADALAEVEGVSFMMPDQPAPWHVDAEAHDDLVRA